MTDTGYPCTECGACCRLGPTRTFGWPLNNEGTACLFLQSDNRCSIYADRPDICRIDIAAEQSGAPLEVYFEACAEACAALQDMEGLDAKFRVRLLDTSLG